MRDSRHLRDARQIAPVVLLDQRDMVERLEVELRRLADGADDRVEALVGPDRRAFVGNAGKPQHQRLELLFLAGELAFDRRRPRAGFLRLARRARLSPRARVLELGADGVALGAQLVDLGLAGAHLAVEREQVVEVEIDALVADRALDRLAVRFDEVQSQHGRVPSLD